MATMQEKRCLIGVVHLLALPGSPRWTGSMRDVEERAIGDARAFEDGGADAVLVENFGDAPFHRGSVEPWVVASMADVVSKVRDRVALPVGVNVLRNDALASLGVCVATGASFLRVNVLCGAYVTDQGLVEGVAAELMRAREALGAQVRVLADVCVKHAAPLVLRDLSVETSELTGRGLADAVIVTGSATGAFPSCDDVNQVVASAGGVPVLVGSGVTPAALAPVLPGVRGAIVGTWVKQAGRVDAERVRTLVRALRGV
jgi:membrane complex biogenesis BtpA family protein